MKDKRDELVSYLTTILQAIDADFVIEDRFREATFNSTNRNSRVAIMGDPAKYCEVLYITRNPITGTAKSTRRRTIHQFEVNIWYGYKDADTYANSSQKVWDEITEGDAGVLPSLESKGTFEGDKLYTIDAIFDDVNAVIALDNTGKELAHYLTFSINLRDNA